MIVLDLAQWDLLLHPGNVLTVVVPPLGDVQGFVDVDGELVLIAGGIAYRLEGSSRWGAKLAPVTQAIIAQADERIVRETLVALIRSDMAAEFQS